MERDRPSEFAKGWFFGSVGDLGARGSGVEASSAIWRETGGGRGVGVDAWIIARSELRRRWLMVVLVCCWVEWVAVWDDVK